MEGGYRFAMDQKDIVRFLITTVGSFTQDRLINKEQRTQHKEQCADRLAAEDGSCDRETEFRYSDQAVLANLDWGIEALEEAIDTSNMETKLARLYYAEKMLQVCALLNSEQRTAGVPNFYLSAWARLNLSYLWKLRNSAENSVLHALEMFIVDPFFSRIDFAPELWKDLFLPQMSSIVGWYSEARHRLMMEVIPDSSDLSFTADSDQFFNESLIYSMRPDQMEKLQNLEELYRESLDENTRLFAKYYKDCMNSDSTTSKKMIPMLPIADPPVTPLHEVSRSIPDYVKFGPILPRSAGFSPVLSSKHGVRAESRLSVISNLSPNLEESAICDPQEAMPEDRKNDSDCEQSDTYIDSEEKNQKLVTLGSIESTESKEIGLSKRPAKAKEPESILPEHSLPELHQRLVLLTHATSLPDSPRLRKDYSSSSPDSDGEVIGLLRSVRKNRSRTRRMSYDNVDNQILERSSLIESDEGSQSYISLPTSEMLTPRSRPPKDFVCPITGQLFNDPVTLETGQTYESKAIQEWVKRGNTTCPITRQALSSNSLPKTNYVLKRLITSWKEQHPELAQEFSADSHMHQRSQRFARAEVSTSPTSVISQATIETIINGLKPYISSLCTSENLEECEAAVSAVAKSWKESKGDPAVLSYLSEPAIVNGIVEILSASVSRDVLRTSVYVLSELTFLDESVREILTSVDSDFDCLAALFKNGLAEAVVLIYQLRPAFSQLSAHSFIPSLVQSIQSRIEDLDYFQFAIEPKDAAIAVFEHLLTGGDENSRSDNAFNVICANGIPALVKCLDRVEGKKSIISILLCCMRADKSYRNSIASTIELSPVLELFHSGNDSVRGLCIDFLSELVQLNRRTFCNQILQIIKDEGAFSTMHTFLVYLQMAPMEQQPSLATLLLQLDLLAEPRKMSIYREEAVEALIEALHRKDFSNSQMMALDALVSISARRTSSGGYLHGSLVTEDCRI
ncbi:RING-TYPE E3 UBIQUITIN TRANSFERASE [Salix koriyanagi]|uniref:RING-type E3 ubiquitin transferase n=1 Tax=Salix koriyanagi TaxID=2511006 RepID=A0A9Q0P3Q9_9ROSI|nr:RING-TYPE E3 UBIQUITIN TRANSFERASE [Salix koriyanagi]